jgi:PII-like signaling protein
MIPVKRLEIVIDAPYSERITDLLARHGIEGWTLLRGATGRGDRGMRFGDEITGVSNNHVIVSTCPPERLDTVIQELRGLLERYGGMCLVSDAHWLRH